ARERDVAELLEADGEDLLRLGDEADVAVDVAGAELAHFGGHALGVAGVVEDAAVVEADAVERVDGDERDVLFELLAGEREQLFEQEGRGDDRRAAVEGEAGVAVDVAAAAGLVALVDERDGEAAGLQADGGGESAEAGADDDDRGRGHER